MVGTDRLKQRDCEIQVFQRDSFIIPVFWPDIR